MDVKEFINELKRMMNSKGITGGICNGVSCSNCEFDKLKDCALGGWNDFESLYEVVNILEKWSREHPKKTNKEVFFKAFPNAQLNSDGLPASCANLLGLVPRCSVHTSCEGCAGCCSECWNSEYNGVDIERLRGDTK